MSNFPIDADSLAAGFPPVSREQWQEIARKGKDPDHALTTEVEEGIAVPWLYDAADELAPDPAGLPANEPFVRGVRDGRRWKIRQEVVQPERELAARQVADDLNGGADEVLVRFDRAARDLAPPDSARFEDCRGIDGVSISTGEDLAELLGDSGGDCTVALSAGRAAIPAAALLTSLRGGRPGPASLRIDPLGALAATGELPRSPEQELAIAASVVSDVERSAGPDTRVLAVDTTSYVDAGATATWELAIAAASGVAYLRVCDAAGVEPGGAAARMEFTLASGADQFLEIAKFRALRRIWARILEASGADPGRRWSPTYARTADRMISALDPWTNMLRVTTATFAAGIGGADGVTATPFDRARTAAAFRDTTPGDAGVAAPGGLGRRIARNTQLILEAESHLGELADPGAGSWYIESLTEEVANGAWQKFQELEREGGIVEALRSGSLCAALDDRAAARREEVVRRRRLLTGVNIYPLLGDDGVEVERVDRNALARMEAARFAERPSIDSSKFREAIKNSSGVLASASELAGEGARIDEIGAVLQGEGFSCTALRTARDAAPFESLRKAADAKRRDGGPEPIILLACLGPIARHVNVANWARSFFECAGIRAINSVDAVDSDPTEAEDPHEAGTMDPADMGRPLQAVGARMAAVCAARNEEPEAVATAVKALREAGAETVFLADPTKEQAEAVSDADPVHDGQDMIAVLTMALNRLGVEIPEGVS